VRAVAFSPDGRTLATAGAGGRTYLWDVRTGLVIATSGNPDGGAVTGVAFSADGRALAVGDNSGHAYLCPMSGPFGRHRSG
jgi:WD40 repeat protein